MRLYQHGQVSSVQQLPGIGVGDSTGGFQHKQQLLCLAEAVLGALGSIRAEHGAGLTAGCGQPHGTVVRSRSIGVQNWFPTPCVCLGHVSWADCWVGGEKRTLWLSLMGLSPWWGWGVLLPCAVGEGKAMNLPVEACQDGRIAQATRSLCSFAEGKTCTKAVEPSLQEQADCKSRLNFVLHFCTKELISEPISHPATHLKALKYCESACHCQYFL